VTPMHDEPAGAMPAAGPRRQVGQGAVMRAVRRLDNWITTEAEIGSKIAARPAADSWGKREDLLSDSET